MFTLLLASVASAQSNEEHLAALRKSIEGREQLPASEVFKNVQKLQKVPAGRLLSIMQMGYSRSLGVGCDHCHSPGRWEDDSKAPKQIARQMIDMAERINGELLPAVAGIADRKPIVNCTTCHRGALKPALNLQ